MYITREQLIYRSPRYGKTITVPAGYRSDGATGAPDISGPFSVIEVNYHGVETVVEKSASYFVHDWMCGNWLGKGPNPPGGQWDDGTPITNWQASQVLFDIMRAEGRSWVRANRWRIGTWLFGGGKARANGRW